MDIQAVESKYSDFNKIHRLIIYINFESNLNLLYLLSLSIIKDFIF